MIEVTFQEKKQAINILCEAYSASFVSKEMTSNQEELNAWVSYVVENALCTGKVYLSDNQVGVAVWRNPKANKWSFNLLKIRVKAMMNLGLSRYRQVRRLEKMLVQELPQTHNAMVLELVGVLPAHRGKGIVNELLESELLLPNKEKIDVFMLAPVPHITKLCKEKGFELCEQTPLPLMQKSSKTRGSFARCEVTMAA
jgi:hypothetical protein